MTDTPHGYTYGTDQVPRSPVTDEQWAELKATVMFTDDDAAALRRAGEVLEDQVSEVLDTWYGFVADHPHLAAYFGDLGGEPIQAYLDGVRPRFEQWVRDTCRCPFDRTWLDYQYEIALRHTPEKKNVTDAVDSVPVVPLRHLIGFVYPVTATMRPFLAAGGDDPVRVEEMAQAWFKAVTLTVALWSLPYAREGRW